MFHVLIMGYETHIHWSENDNVYWGKIEGIPEEIKYKKESDGMHGQMLQFAVSNMFVKVVKEYIEKQQNAN